MEIDAEGVVWRREKVEPPDPEEIRACRLWLRRRARKLKTINHKANSYVLKHWMHSETGAYAGNGAFIAAALSLGYRVHHERGPNAFFNMGLKDDDD